MLETYSTAQVGVSFVHVKKQHRVTYPENMNTYYCKSKWDS